MIIIELTNEEVFGETGPNFIWTVDTKKDLETIIEMIQSLCLNHKKIEIITSPQIKLENLKLVTLNQSENGNILSKLLDNSISIDLSKERWTLILEKIETLKNQTGFQYLEIDNENLIEDTNWVIYKKSTVIKKI